MIVFRKNMRGYQLFVPEYIGNPIFSMQAVLEPPEPNRTKVVEQRISEGAHGTRYSSKFSTFVAGRPGSSEVPRNPLTRWDVSSIPANGIFLTKKLKNKIKMPNGWRTIKSLVHKIRLHGRRGKGMAESFSRDK